MDWQQMLSDSSSLGTRIPSLFQQQGGEQWQQSIPPQQWGFDQKVVVHCLGIATGVGDPLVVGDAGVALSLVIGGVGDQDPFDIACGDIWVQGAQFFQF